MKILTPNSDYVFTGRDEDKDPSDDHNLDFKVIKETWVENVYQIHESDFYDSGIFVDIGANIGSVSLFVDSMNHNRSKDLPAIRTIAIEPEPHNISILEHNIATNPVTDNLKIFKHAIWHVPGRVQISDQGGNAKIVGGKGESTEVQAVTIGQMMIMNNISEIDVMKVDIEGAEYDLLINTPYEVLSKIKYLALEFEQCEDEKFGTLVQKLAHIFGIQILGSPRRGGYIYGRRY